MKIRPLLQGFCIAGCIGIVVFVSLGVQSQTKNPKVKPKLEVAPPATQVPATKLLPDSLLPDTTQGKVDLLLEKVKELETAVRIDSLRVEKEVQENKLMKKNSEVLDFVANKVNVDPLPTPDIKPSTLAYPDTLTIVIKKERRSIFKRKKQ